MTTKTFTSTTKAHQSSKRGNGEGTIRQRTDGNWEARVALEGGKRKSFYGKTRHEVASKLAAATRDRDRGLHIATDERQTVKSFATGWLDRMQHRLRASTHRRYGEHLANVTTALGSVRLVKLTPTQVEALYAAKLTEGQSTTTVNHMHMVLKSALKDAVRKHLIPYNVCEVVTGVNPSTGPCGKGNSAGRMRYTDTDRKNEGEGTPCVDAPSLGNSSWMLCLR